MDLAAALGALARGGSSAKSTLPARGGTSLRCVVLLGWPWPSRATLANKHFSALHGAPNDEHGASPWWFAESQHLRVTRRSMATLLHLSPPLMRSAFHRWGTKYRRFCRVTMVASLSLRKKSTLPTVFNGRYGPSIPMTQRALKSWRVPFPCLNWDSIYECLLILLPQEFQLAWYRSQKTFHNSNLGTYEPLQTWNANTLEPCNPGTLKSCNSATLQPCCHTTLNSGTLDGMLQWWRCSALKPLNQSILEHSRHLQPCCFLNPETRKLWKRWSWIALEPGTVQLWKSGTMERRNLVESSTII